MKININFDLIERIEDANVGISLSRVSKQFIKGTIISSSVITLLSIPLQRPLEDMIQSIGFSAGLNAFAYTAIDLITAPLFKKLSREYLKILSYKLKTLNVNTNYELLMNSEKYKTEYELIPEENKLPQLEQKKYIMVPVIEDNEEREVSILQEHILGTKEYTLSIGEPKKALKLVPSKNTN